MTDFQASASRQGRNFEQAVESMLVAFGWSIEGVRVTHACGVEVDIVAIDPGKVRWYIECKGSHRGQVPGARRGDTVKKAVGVAWYLKHHDPGCKYMLVTSHMPRSESVGGRMLDDARRVGLFDAISVLALSTIAYDEDLPDDEAES